MSLKVPGLVIWIGLIAGAVISMTVPAYAINFAIAPVDVTINSRERSHLIVVTNQDNVPLRFQLSAYRWDERPDGQMVLEPTEDVIFFPRLFDIQPHESQNLRVGALAPAVDSEKTYRLVLRQLKSFQPPRPAGSKRAVVVNVLTNVSIPVFVEPLAPVARAGISSMTLKGGTLSFTVRNSGNAHFRIKSMRVEGFGSGTEPVFSKTAKGWYVLAGGSRNYELKLPAGDCTRVNRLNLLVQTEQGELRSELPAGPANCPSAETMAKHTGA